MGEESTKIGDRRWPSRLRRSGLPVRLAACFATIAFASGVIPWVEHYRPENNLLWVANGLFLAYLLLAPRWRWPAYAVTGFAALSVRVLFMPHSWRLILIYNVLDMVEIGTAAFLLRRRSAELPRFTDGGYLVLFMAFGVRGGPLLAGGLFALAMGIWPEASQSHPFLSWFAADCLGIAICTPAFVAVFRTHLSHAVDWRREWYFPALLLGVTLGAFSQDRVPLFYLVYPLVVVVLVRLGLGYAALFTLCVTAVAGWMTLHGQGPFAARDLSHPFAPALQMQTAIASAMLLIYLVSVVLEGRREIERRLEKIVALHTLVTENSRDAIILADFHGNRSYVSSAVERLTGWPPVEFARMKSLDLLHPEDLPMAREMVGALRGGAEGARIECRVRKYSGEYIWVEASLRIVRDGKTGAPSEILNIVRDVTERKLAEKKLKEAYKALEALAATDSLTGLANRRQFEETLNGEWRRGLRDHCRISLLMIDADLFKSYNDRYGHMRGDSCLKQIAEAAQDVVARPGDLVARFGGEEFAVILPNTGREGALQLANEINEAMRAKSLEHRDNPAGIVTVSIGCATIAPAFGLHAVDLIEQADKALYMAKRSGRDRACDGSGTGSEAERLG